MNESRTTVNKNERNNYPHSRLGLEFNRNGQNDSSDGMVFK